jgi:hypothetical protein
MIEKIPIEHTTTFNGIPVKFSFYSEGTTERHGADEKFTRQFYISINSEQFQTKADKSPFFKITVVNGLSSSTIGPLPKGDSDLFWHVCGLIDHYVERIEPRA